MLNSRRCSGGAFGVCEQDAVKSAPAISTSLLILPNVSNMSRSPFALQHCAALDDCLAENIIKEVFRNTAGDAANASIFAVRTEDRVSSCERNALLPGISRQNCTQLAWVSTDK
jgi:hypothetical protein